MHQNLDLGKEETVDLESKFLWKMLGPCLLLYTFPELVFRRSARGAALGPWWPEFGAGGGGDTGAAAGAATGAGSGSTAGSSDSSTISSAPVRA